MNYFLISQHVSNPTYLENLPYDVLIPFKITFFANCGLNAEVEVLLSGSEMCEVNHLV